MTSPTRSRSPRRLISSAAISVPSSTAPPRMARPMPGAEEETAEHRGEHEVWRDVRKRRRRRVRTGEPGNPDGAAQRERRAHLMEAERDKRQIDRRQQHRKRHARDAASSIETPVTPPSMKWLDSRNPLIPIAADRIARDQRTAFRSSRRRRMSQSSVPEVPAPGEHHRQAVLVGGGDHFRIADRPAGLHDGGRAGGRHRVEPVAEREERVGRGDRSVRARRRRSRPPSCAPP